MRFFRLPARSDEQPTSWQWGCSRSTVILLPGDALLCESVELPPGVTRVRAMKEWLHASAPLCQLRPDQDKLLMVRREGDDCVYWAVDQGLWKYWEGLVKKFAPSSRWMPDWMLLPEPDGAQPFAIKTDDCILFRHAIGRGGALPFSQEHLLAPLRPRWLTCSGEAEGYPVSPLFWQQQIQRYAHRRMAYPPSVSVNAMLPTLMAISSAFLVWQMVNVAWLWSTRTPEPEHIVEQKMPPVMHSALPGAIKWLNQAQYLGPVQLRRFQLDGAKVTMELISPVLCDELQPRLKELLPVPRLQPQGDACHMFLQGNLSDDR